MTNISGTNNFCFSVFKKKKDIRNIYQVVQEYSQGQEDEKDNSRYRSCYANGELMNRTFQIRRVYLRILPSLLMLPHSYPPNTLPTLYSSSITFKERTERMFQMKSSLLTRKIRFNSIKQRILSKPFLHLLFKTLRCNFHQCCF